MKDRSFTSSMTPREYAAALLWLPVHLVLLPLLCVRLIENGSLTESQANLLVYGAGALCLSLLCFGFLRRDFDPLCDNLPGCLLEILLSYGLMLGCNLIASTLLNLLENLLGNSSELLNQNNEALIDLAGEDFGSISAVAVFLAPITEELMFRGGIFGLLRKKSRAWAYAAGTLLFALYHIWGYALLDPTYWLYLLQYLPAGYLLCRCYERTNSIWCSIFFHMLVNLISLRLLMLIQQLL